MKVLIDETLRRSALEVVHHVAAPLSNPAHVAEIVRLTTNQTSLSIRPQWHAISVVYGDAALALFFGQMDRCFPDQGWDRIAHTYIVSAAQALEATPRLSSFSALFGGLAGLCFAIYSLSRNGVRYSHLLSTLDSLLLRKIPISASLSDSFLNGVEFSDYDLITGPVGVGAYLLLRLELSEAIAAISSILDRLIFLSEYRDGRLCFFIPPERQATERHAKQYPDGAIDCGLAHGVTGPLAFLALASLSDVKRPGLAEAIRRLADWIVTRRYDDSWGINWPYAVSPDDRTPLTGASHAAWCYGSPGIARALWFAGCALQDSELKAIAVEAMDAVRRRPNEARRIASPILCHGIAGLLQVALRFANDTAHPFFIEMISELVQQLLGTFEPDSLVGFRDIMPDGSRIDNAGLLEGAAGIALTLLSAATNVDPFWDHMFLLS